MDMLTIGELARRVGMRTSTLRYYEQEGLLKPAARTEAGYRLYTEEGEKTLRFIQQAQRLGFSLADIRQMLPGQDVSNERIVTIAENRLVDIERQLTELRVVRHEMELFLLDLRREIEEVGGDGVEPLLDRLIDRVCARPAGPSGARLTLQWLFDRTDCVLAHLDEETVLGALRGRHMHVWLDDGVYYILVVGHDEAVQAALSELARIEADCHAHPAPGLSRTDEGYLFTAHGENAFLFAQLFLALEEDDEAAISA